MYYCSHGCGYLAISQTHNGFLNLELCFLLFWSQLDNVAEHVWLQGHVVPQAALDAVKQAIQGTRQNPWVAGTTWIIQYLYMHKCDTQDTLSIMWISRKNLKLNMHLETEKACLIGLSIKHMALQLCNTAKARVLSINMVTQSALDAT